MIIFNLHLHYFSSHIKNVINNKSTLNPWTYYDPKVHSPYSFHLLDKDEEILADFWFDYLTKNKII